LHGEGTAGGASSKSKAEGYGNTTSINVGLIKAPGQVLCTLGVDQIEIIIWPKVLYKVLDGNSDRILPTKERMTLGFFGILEY